MDVAEGNLDGAQARRTVMARHAVDEDWPSSNQAQRGVGVAHEAQPQLSREIQERSAYTELEVRSRSLPNSSKRSAAANVRDDTDVERRVRTRHRHVGTDEPGRQRRAEGERAAVCQLRRELAQLRTGSDDGPKQRLTVRVGRQRGWRGLTFEAR